MTTQFEIVTPAMVKRMFMDKFHREHDGYDALIQRIEAVEPDEDGLVALQVAAYDPSRYPHFIELETA